MKRFISSCLMLHSLVVLGQGNSSFYSADTTVISGVEISTYRLKGDKSNLHNARYSQRDLSRLGILSASELLQTVSSAHINSYGPSGLASPSIRGTGASHTQVYWNGLPINSITLGQSDLTIITTELSDNVSIHYGSDLSNSSGALGGTIELNQAISWKSSSISYKQLLGSFNTNGTTIRIDESVGPIHYTIGAVRLSSLNDFQYTDRTLLNPIQKTMENANFDQMGLLGTIATKLEKHEIKVTSLITDSERRLPTIMGVQSKGEKQLDKNIFGVIDYQFVGEKIKTQLKLGYVRLENRYLNPSIDFQSLNLSQMLTIEDDIKYYFNRVWSLSMRIAGRFEHAQSPNFNQRVKREVFSNFSKIERRKENSNHSFSLRTEFIDRKGIGLFPAISGSIKPIKNKSLRLTWNGSRNFRMPTLNDLYWVPGGNVTLLPEKGYSGDFGLSSNLLSNKKRTNSNVIQKLTFKAVSFYSLISNWILWTPNGQNWSPRNVKKVQNSGLEFSLNLNRTVHAIRSSKSLGFSLSYTLVDNTVLESTLIGDKGIGNSLLFVPKHCFKYNIDYQINGWSVLSGQGLTGRVFLDAANQSYMPFYGPVYLIVSKEIKYKNSTILKLGLKVNNVLNEEYQVMPYRPMPGVNFKIMGEVNF